MDEARPYATAAAHYLLGRPPYSAALADVLRSELGLDGSGTLVDVGCGPGVLVVQLASLFDAVIGVDPEPAMLAEARRHAGDHDVTATWIEARAEQLAQLSLPAPRLITFGQSLHWTDRQPVLEAVHDLLEPGGAVALLAPSIEHGAAPADPPAPPIPHDQVEVLLERYLGWTRGPRTATYETSLEQSPFGDAHVVYAPGRTDIVRTTEGVIAGYLSMSFAAPDRFGDRLDAFVADMRALLEATSPTGRFFDWPGDTAIIWAAKRSA